MFRYLLVLLIMAYSHAGDSYGGYSSGGYSSGGGYSQQSGGGYGPVPAAISSRRTVEIKPVSLPQDPIYPQILEVAPLELPIQIIYNSKSSPVLVHQNHIPGAKGQVERTSSEEEPHKVIHEVLRPVIQEIREVITPYRRVVQEIQPVIETVNTIVAKGERVQGAKIEAPVSGPINIPSQYISVGGSSSYSSGGSKYSKRR